MTSPTDDVVGVSTSRTSTMRGWSYLLYALLWRGGASGTPPIVQLPSDHANASETVARRATRVLIWRLPREALAFRVVVDTHEEDGWSLSMHHSIYRSSSAAL